MKYLCLTLGLLSFSALALDVKVSALSPEAGMERSFQLRTNLKEKVLLDCQSFLQGLYIGPRSAGKFSMLDPFECEELHSRIQESVEDRHKHCLDVQEDQIVSDYSC